MTNVTNNGILASRLFKKERLILINHFENIENMYGNVGVRIPNRIFKDLSSGIKAKNDKTNVQQVAFSYSYLLIISFLYKYANFVDVNDGTYIQNGDIKELLGYNRTTKTIDRIIKGGGVLDTLGITKAIKSYPIRFETNQDENINGINLREFTFVDELNEDDIIYDSIKNIVKNRNYMIKEPLFMTGEYHDNDYGTLYSIEKTHMITISEFIKLATDDDIDNVSIMIYCFLKSKCKGYIGNTNEITYYKMSLELGISNDTLSNRLEILKKKKYISITHENWKRPIEGRDDLIMKASEYTFLGV